MKKHEYDYTAYAGLALLEFLGINICGPERKIFLSNWKKNYNDLNPKMGKIEKLIETTYTLYAFIAPFWIDFGMNPYIHSGVRNHYFKKNLKDSGLEKILKKTSIENIEGEKTREKLEVDISVFAYYFNEYLPLSPYA